MAKTKTRIPVSFVFYTMRFEQPLMALNENGDGDFFFDRDVNAPVITQEQILDFIEADDPTTFEIDQIRLEIPAGKNAVVQHVVNRTKILHAEVLPAGCALQFKVTIYALEGIDALNHAMSKGRLAPFETEDFGRFKYDTTTLDNPEYKATTTINRLAGAIKQEG